MKSTQDDVPSDQHHFLNAVAPSGRSIEPCVFLAAQGIADHAIFYAEKFLRDSCVALNLLEEAAATVSEVIRAKDAAQIAPIRDVRRYLFRVFLRKVADAKRNETTYEDVSQWHSHPRDDSQGDGLDSQILLERKVPQANCRQDRRRVRAAELDLGLSCTECTENGGRTNGAGCSVSDCNMRN